MMAKQIKNTTITLDPLDVYKHIPNVYEACGLLAEWLWEGAEFDEQPLERVLEESYPYFMGWRCDEAMVKEDKFCYPGDPELAPLLKAVRGDETVYIYPHGIVAVYKDDTTKWTRMD